MPSTKQRVNLTLSDEIYSQLQRYKSENGIFGDATACLQLVVKGLQSYETQKSFSALLSNLSLEQLKDISNEGWDVIDKLNNGKK